MEVWLEEKKPEVMSTTNVVLALVLHALFFAAVFTFAKFHFKPRSRSPSPRRRLARSA